MTIASFIVKNALRNKRRALLCILSVAVSLFLFVTLLVGLREMTVPPEDVNSATRIIVRNKISLANVLPARQRTVVERIPGVEAVTPFTFFGGKFQNEQPMFAQFALDVAQLPRILLEAHIPAEQFKAFLEDSTSCVIGRLTAEKYKLKIGVRMTLVGTFYPCTLELKIVGLYEGTLDDRSVFFHHKYFDEATGNTGIVGTWWVKARSLEEMPAVLDKLNHAFVNTSAEVRAESERAFQMSFVSMWGNISLLIHSICSVVVFTLVLVTASTMSMAIRERFRELAVLKALGFRRRELFAFILAESFGLSMLGALLGIGGAYVLFTQFSIAKMTQGILVLFELTPKIMGLGALVATALGIVAAIAPSIAAARMSVVQGLKTLD